MRFTLLTEEKVTKLLKWNSFPCEKHVLHLYWKNIFCISHQTCLHLCPKWKKKKLQRLSSTRSKNLLYCISCSDASYSVLRDTCSWL